MHKFQEEGSYRAGQGRHGAQYVLCLLLSHRVLWKQRVAAYAQLGPSPRQISLSLTAGPPESLCLCGDMPNTTWYLGANIYITFCSFLIAICVFLIAERLVVVSEHYSTSLQCLIQKKKIFGRDLQTHITKSVVEALQYLHSQNIVHRNLHSKNILVTPEGVVKLSAYGMYYMTRYGTLVSFPIG